MSFPDGFVWGAAQCSFQIEGAAFEDGKGPSIWDIFSHESGKMFRGQTGDVSADHYHRYPEDCRLLGEIGIQLYRFSVSWSRVLPEGTGKVNQKGLDFYDRLVNECLKNNIRPCACLFHFDYPYALHLRGGFLNRDISDWFAEYTKVVIDRLSDRVIDWMTMNEPAAFVGGAYEAGINPPGIPVRFPDVLLAAHNTLLSHGKSIQVIRTRAKKKPIVGLPMVALPRVPATESLKDIEAARSRMFSFRNKRAFSYTWYADPMFFGKYPEDGVKLFGRDIPKFPASDMKIISQPLDYFGLNIYSGQIVKATLEGSSESVPFPNGAPQGSTDWIFVLPEIGYWAPKFIYERYQRPIVITENGISSCLDWVHRDGRVHDPYRIDYIARHLLNIKRATDEGIPIQGYHVWASTDGLEWTLGYKQRFGLIHIDYATQKRTLKDSAFWYRDLIRSNGASLSTE